MTGKVSPDEDVRLAEASDWLVRLQGDDVSETDALDFDAWLQAAPENIRAYDQVLTAWHAFGGGEQTVLDELAALEQRRIKQGFGRRWLLGGVGGAVAAAALAAVVLPGMLLEPAIQSYATGKGERETVKLADGSTVDLNAQTRLNVTLARHERHVAMGEGEAIFDVAADARRPFIIQAGDHTVRVVGTQFNVRNRADGLAVTVARGVVEVRATGKDAKRAYLLHPGQKLDFTQNGQTQLSAVAPAEALGWRSGRIVYRGEPLSTVVADLNRQFETPIRIADPQLADMRVSGVLVVDNQPQVIQRLTLMFPLSAIPSDQGVLLRRK